MGVRVRFGLPLNLEDDNLFKTKAWKSTDPVAAVLYYNSARNATPVFEVFIRPSRVPRLSLSAIPRSRVLEFVEMEPCRELHRYDRIFDHRRFRRVSSCSCHAQALKSETRRNSRCNCVDYSCVPIWVLETEGEERDHEHYSATIRTSGMGWRSAFSVSAGSPIYTRPRRIGRLDTFTFTKSNALTLVPLLLRNTRVHPGAPNIP